MASKYSLFHDKWKNCTKCELHEKRSKVVVARGTVPCKVLFVGEAPGESENVVGKPFVGPSGRLLDLIIKRSIECSTLCKECGKLQYVTPSGIVCSNGHGGANEMALTYALTNIVCCIPRDEEGSKVSEPPEECIEACSERLIEFVDICKPRLIVAVGKLAEDYIRPGYNWSIKLTKKIPTVAIAHPASILRANVANQGLAIQRCVVTITDALEEYLK